MSYNLTYAMPRGSSASWGAGGKLGLWVILGLCWGHVLAGLCMSWDSSPGLGRHSGTLEFTNTNSVHHVRPDCNTSALWDICARFEILEFGYSARHT
jgi:hypothetical protein